MVYTHSKQLPNNLGEIVGSGNCLVVVHNLFPPFNLSLNFLLTVIMYTVKIQMHNRGTFATEDDIGMSKNVL